MQWIRESCHQMAEHEIGRQLQDGTRADIPGVHQRLGHRLEHGATPCERLGEPARQDDQGPGLRWAF